MRFSRSRGDVRASLAEVEVSVLGQCVDDLLVLLGGPEEDGWPVGDLVGLRAELVDGTPAGVVAGLERSPAHDLLVITEPSGGTALVPFVAALVPVVDVAGGRLVLDPPGGLLEVAPAVDDGAGDRRAP